MVSANPHSMKEAFDDPNHPIIDRPFEYRITSFTYHRVLDGSEESHIDLVLQRGESVRRLRFLSPQSISIERTKNFFVRYISRKAAQSGFNDQAMPILPTATVI